MSKKKLGRGLDAIFNNYGEKNEAISVDGQSSYKTKIEDADKAHFSSIQKINPRLLKPNPHQPRTVFSEKALEELSSSIKEHGIIQPVVISKDAEGNTFILAGERRTRAAIMAGLEEIPVILADIEPEQNLELALIENIQREDLNPIEEARAYKKLLNMYDLSHEELAKKLGKSRPAITNVLRLLQLPDYAIEALEAGKISQGHARAILSLNLASEQKKLFTKILEDGISVREAESLATKLNAGEKQKNLKTKNSSSTLQTNLSPELASIQQKLLEKLGTKVIIKGTEEGGTVEITYFSKDDLNSLYEKILGDAE